MRFHGLRQRVRRLGHELFAFNRAGTSTDLSVAFDDFRVANRR